MKDMTIQKYRRDRDLSQQQFADILNLPRTTVSFYETKRQYPNLGTAERMADVLGKTIGQLYSDEELVIIK